MLSRIVVRAPTALQIVGLVIPQQAHLDRVDHVGAVRRRHDLVAMARNDGRGAGAQPVDDGGHFCGVRLQQIADGLCRENVTAAAVDPDGDFADRPQLREIVRKLLWRHFVAPPARF